MIAALAVWLFLMLLVLAICSDSKRREYDAARRRHPANFTPATEAAIEQAIAIIDDGKSVVAEAEAIVREAASDA